MLVQVIFTHYNNKFRLQLKLRKRTFLIVIFFRKNKASKNTFELKYWVGMVN